MFAGPLLFAERGHRARFELQIVELSGVQSLRRRSSGGPGGCFGVRDRRAKHRNVESRLPLGKVGVPDVRLITDTAGREEPEQRLLGQRSGCLAIDGVVPLDASRRRNRNRQT